jgi:hypothetical protein
MHPLEPIEAALARATQEVRFDVPADWRVVSGLDDTVRSS